MEEHGTHICSPLSIRENGPSRTRMWQPLQTSRIYKPQSRKKSKPLSSCEDAAKAFHNVASFSGLHHLFMSVERNCCNSSGR